MKKILILLFCTISFLCSKSQSICDDYIGYDKNGDLVGKHFLKGFLSQKDTSVKAGLFVRLLKTEKSNGLMIWGIFDKSIGTIDASTKVKIIFHDNSNIILDAYSYMEPNSLGFYSANLVSDKYRLLFLKTKSPVKIQITGDLINPMTYEVDFMLGQSFMIEVGCLQEYL